MASKSILATLANIVSCVPCTGTLGRWKSQLQDDDADLWNDLTLISAIPDVKPPDIPRVVEVISCSDGSSEDVSTLAYDNIFPHSEPSSPRDCGNSKKTRRKKEQYCTRSPTRAAEFPQQPRNKRPSRYHADPDPELEQVLEEIGLEDRNEGKQHPDDSDDELESIMGPRSQISAARSHASRSIRRASSAPVVATSTTTTTLATRVPSLLQQHQREYFQSTHATLMRQFYSDSPSPSKEDFEDKERRENFDDEIPSGLGDDDGSSYSSVNRKLSFFKRKRASFFRSGSGGSYKKAGVHGGWMALEHNGSFEEDTYSTTFETKHLPRSPQSRARFNPFH